MTTHLQLNILITQSKRACLTDFGVAVAKDNTNMAITTTNNNLGTLRWQAPELLDPEADDASCVTTLASDVYAYGCVCYEVVQMALQIPELLLITV